MAKALSSWGIQGNIYKWDDRCLGFPWKSLFLGEKGIKMKMDSDLTTVEGSDWNKGSLVNYLYFLTHSRFL